MTEERDPLLESLFAASAPVGSDDVFTKQVLSNTYALRRKLITIGMFALVLLTGYVWLFGVPLQDFVLLITQLLSTNIIDMEESWLALVLAPLNSVAGILALALKAMMSVFGRLRLFSL